LLPVAGRWRDQGAGGRVFMVAEHTVVVMAKCHVWTLDEIAGVLGI